MSFVDDAMKQRVNIYYYFFIHKFEEVGIKCQSYPTEIYITLRFGESVIKYINH